MILISHSDENMEQANTLVNFLHENIEIPDEDLLRSCDSWRGSTDVDSASRKLKSCMSRANALIAIISPEDTMRSEIMFELGAAWSLNVFILMIFLPGVDVRDVPEPLADCSFVDVDSKDAHIRLRDATRDIASLLGLPEKRGMHVFSSLDNALKSMRRRPAEAPADHAPSDADESLEFIDEDRISLDRFVPSTAEFYNIVYTVRGKTSTEEINVKATWNSIFKAIAPHLREPQDDAFIKKLILELCKEKNPDLRRGIEYNIFLNPMLNVECYSQIINQFSSQNFIETTRPPHSIFKKRDNTKYWIITAEGEEHLRSSIEKLRSLSRG
jgi:hypothetical protein